MKEYPTPKQTEALKVAREVGYFTLPREGDLAEIAEELGISQAAASQRLRRAQSICVENQLRNQGELEE